MGGTKRDELTAISQTTDGGYIIGGYSESNDGDVTGHHGSTNGSDYWIVKLDGSGNLQWQKSLGGTASDILITISQTSDGGYIAGGHSNSTDGDVTGHHGLANTEDYWIVKLDSSGNLQWQKSLGGTQSEYLSTLSQTTDGYILGGTSLSLDGNVTGHHGSQSFIDYWIVKLDASGNLQWQKSLGGTNDDILVTLSQTTDGGCIAGGYSLSNDGDVTGHHGTTSFRDYWIIKLNANGNQQWQKSLGGTNLDELATLSQTTDGGYIVGGSSVSTDGDVTGNHGNSQDYWIVKLDGSGNLQWQKSLGGTAGDYLRTLNQTTDGNYIAAGNSYSNDGDVTGHNGGALNKQDYWIVKLDANGNLQWQKSLGGTAGDYLETLNQTTDGNYIVAGNSDSNDGDVTGHHGALNRQDYWIVKLGTSTSVENIFNTNFLKIYPNPTTGIFTIKTTNEGLLEILTLHGELIKREVITKNEIVINLPDLSKGIYLLRYISKSEIQTNKIIIQ